MFHMRSKLNLGLKSTKLTSFLEGDRVGAIQDVISCLQSTAKGGECCLGYRDTPTALLPLSLPPHARQVLSLPAHREGSAGQGPGSPHSGLSRRTSSGAEASRAPPLPVPSASGHGPASSLGHRESPQCQAPRAPMPSNLWLFVCFFISYPLSLIC